MPTLPSHLNIGFGQSVSLIALRLCVSAVILVTFATAQAPPTGVLEINGRVKIDGKQERLKRKRFYLFRGGLAANKALIDRIRTADFISRDCFYCRMNASPEFRAWLKAEDCESPFCRKITAEDAARVPEFKAAVAKGNRQFVKKPALSIDWLTTNLDPGLRDGFFLERRKSINAVLAGMKPIMSAMTDSVSVKAIFIDIPVAPTAGRSTETFLVSNLAPFEIGGKSYTWACEVEIGSDKKVVRSLPVPEPGKRADKCEVFIRDVPVCDGQSCQVK